MLKNVLAILLVFGFASVSFASSVTSTVNQNMSTTGTPTFASMTLTGTSNNNELLITGYSTQTANILLIQNSSDVAEASLDNSGDLTINGTLTTGGTGQSNTGYGLVVNSGYNTTSNGGDFVFKNSSGTTIFTLGATNGYITTNLTASEPVFTDGSSDLITGSLTGTGTQLVTSTSPTITTPSITTSETITRTSLGTTPTDSLLLTNTTAAASSAQQYSPAIHLEGQGWKTASTAASQDVDFHEYLVPVQGSANPSSILNWDFAVNGGSYTNEASLTSAGLLTVQNLTIASMTGTNCLEEVSGVVTSTGSACGSGGGGSMTYPSGTGVAVVTSGASWGTTLSESGTGSVMLNTSPELITSLLDTNGNTLLGVTATASAVNYLTIGDSATTYNPGFTASGSDTNIGIYLTPKGTGGVVVAGSSLKPALNLTSNTLESSPNAGDFEYDGNNPYFTPVGTSRGAIPAMQVVMLTSPYSLSSDSAQKIFNVGSSSGGAPTLASSTTYFFDMMLQVSALSSSSNTVSLTWATTGTIGSIAYQAITTRLAANGTAIAADQTGSNQASATIICAASATTSAQIYVTGIIRMTTGGTLTPELSESGTATPTIAANSYLKVYPVDTNTTTTVGNIV